MRQSLGLLTFGKDKVALDTTTLYRLVDLFQDYKEKRADEQEYYLDLTKELHIEKYSISERELVAFFSKGTEDTATRLTETQFYNIVVSFDKSLAGLLEDKARDSTVVPKQQKSDSDDERPDPLANTMQVQKLGTILKRLQEVPKFKEGVAKELSSVLQTCVEE